MLNVMPPVNDIALAERYRAAFAKIKSGRAQWIEGTLELAVVVAQLRNRYPDHSEFSRWLERYGLQEIKKDARASLVGFASLKEQAARELLERSTSWSWDLIWRNRPNKPEAALRRIPKGRPGRVSRDRKHASGASKRNRIPTVMQDDPLSGPPAEPPPVRKGILLKGLTREQVDPDFKGTPLEFTTKYGHVNLQTKIQIEENKRQEALMAWLGTLSEHARTAQAMVAAFAAVDPVALRQWTAKPGKADKLRAWCNDVQLACEHLAWHKLSICSDGKVPN